MKKILIITYYWPPSGGAAVQRWLSFANKLAENNYEVHVLTVAESNATYQLWDEDLLKAINPDVNVYTTKTREPFKVFSFLFGKKNLPKPAFANETNSSFIKKISRFIRGNFFIPDPRKGWRTYAVKQAEKIINQAAIPVVITAGPPHSTHFIGKDLKNKLGILWIADFHDLWTDVIYYDMLYHLPIVKKIDSRMEKDILESCDKVITVGEKYKKKLLSKSPDLSEKKIEVLQIGYDETLFKALRLSEAQNKFVITYTGTIADFYQPDVFINALATTVRQHPDVAFVLRFAGVLSDGIKQKIITAGLENVLDYVGYLPHNQSIELLKQSTILLLVNPVTKDEEMVIPGKVYEYLAANKPIVNITRHNAETAAIIKNCEAGKTFERNEQASLEAYLDQLVTQWKKDKIISFKNNENCVAKYSRAAITNKLIVTVEQLTSS